METERSRSRSASLGTKKLKPGKSTTLKVKVAAGSKAVAGVKACASVAKAKRKAIKVGGCKAVGNLAAGASATARLKVKATGKARGKYRITTRVTGSGIGPAATTVALKVAR